MDKLNEQNIFSSETDTPISWDPIDESFFEDDPELYWGDKLPE